MIAFDGAAPAREIEQGAAFGAEAQGPDNVHLAATFCFGSASILKYPWGQDPVRRRNST